MKSCGENLGPGSYDALAQFKKLTHSKCSVYMTPLSIPANELKDYYYSGHALQHDPNVQKSGKASSFNRN